MKYYCNFDDSSDIIVGSESSLFVLHQEVMSLYGCCICIDAMIGRGRLAIVYKKNMNMIVVCEDLVLSGGSIVPSTSADIKVNHLV